MAKHGICPTSNKRNFGKGRKKKATIITKRFMGCMWWGDYSGEMSYPARVYRTRNQSSRDGMSAPSRKRVKDNRRRARKEVRRAVVSVQREVKAEKDAKRAALVKLKKEHATKTRQMQKRFLRDIHLLWEKQENELVALEDSI